MKKENSAELIFEFGLIQLKLFLTDSKFELVRLNFFETDS